MKKIIYCLLSVLILGCLCACDEPEEVQPQQTATIYDVIGKTYYNQKDPSACITLYKEGDFELYETFENKTVLVRGDYKQRDNEYDLYPLNNDQFPSKIVFIAEEDGLILSTDLFVSKDKDLYVLKENLKETNDPKTDNNTQTNSPVSDPKVNSEKNENAIYYNTAQPSIDLGISTLELREDGTFSFTEIEGMGAVLIEGRYGREGNVYMFSNFEDFYNFDGEEVTNFEFFLLEDGTIQLNEDLQSTKKGTIFSKIKPQEKKTATIMTFIHASMDDVLDEYLPIVEMKEDGTFLFTENVYAGMVSFFGHFEEIPKGYRFYIDENENMKGFAGDDLKEFTICFDKSSGNYRIDVDICMTRANDIFYVAQ